MAKKNGAEKAARLRWTARDSVFTFLCRRPEYLRELYLSLHPEDAGVREEDIRLVTLENVLINGQHNDLGFLVRDTLIVLAEAQTTYSPNLPLRLLLYIAETYKRLADERKWDLYSSGALEIPVPEFVVIYTGDRRNIPGRLRLSSLYKKTETPPGSGVLDAEVRILRFRGKMDLIDQYVRFCEITAEKEKAFGRTQEAVDAIFQACLEEGILVPFLRTQEKEVRDIMTSLFDEKRIQEIHDNTVRQEGRTEGRAEGLREGEAKGRAEGEAKGRAEGKAEGRAEGRAEGKADVVMEMLRDNAPLSLIEKYTQVSGEKIMEIARSIGVSPAV